MTVHGFDEATWDFGALDVATRAPGPPPDSTGGFPERWRAFGPLPPDTTHPVGYSCMSNLGGFSACPGVHAEIATLTSIPDRLRVGDALLPGRDLACKKHTLDFAALFEGATLGSQAWAVAEYTCAEAKTLILGATADYWMQWWIDGAEVLSTLDDGNRSDPTGAHPPAPGDFCVRHTFAPGRHLIAVRVIGGDSGWNVQADFVDANAELQGTRRHTCWEIHDDGKRLLPPCTHAMPGIAVRANTSLHDETITCDFLLHGHNSTAGVVLAAQDGGHYYWVYHPRWGQNWRMRAFYLCIAKVTGTTNVTNLAMMRMPNVVCHADARHQIEVQRCGSTIRTWVDGVIGPTVVDDTYGAGAVGVRGWADCELIDFHAEGTVGQSSKWQPDVAPVPTWYHPTGDTGYGTIRNQNNCLVKLSGGQILTAITSHDAGFYEHDPHAQIQHYLSDDEGLTWKTHGGTLSRSLIPPGTYIPIDDDVVRLVATAPVENPTISNDHPVAMREQDSEGSSDTVRMNLPSSWRDNVAWVSNQLKMVYRDSSDKGLTWSDPKDAEMHGDWRSLFGGPFRVLMVQVKQLRDGALLAIFLREFPNRLLKEFYEQLPRPEVVGESSWPQRHAAGFCSRSADGGKNWNAPVPLDTAAFVSTQPPESPLADYSEVALAQLPTGRIVALTRTVRSPHNWQTWSDDNGRTWRQACYGTFAITGGPIMVGTASGYLAVVGREGGLTLHTSVDGGLNWDAGTVLDPDPWCNPAMIESEPDVLLIFNHAPAPDLRSPGMPKLFRMRMTDKGPVPLFP